MQLDSPDESGRRLKRVRHNGEECLTISSRQLEDVDVAHDITAQPGGLLICFGVDVRHARLIALVA